MALEHLLAELRQRAAAELSAIRERADAEARTIAAASDERIAVQQRETLGARETELRRQSATAVAQAARRARRTELEARERLLERVFAAARERLPAAAAAPANHPAAARRLNEALAYLGDRPGVIRCAPGLSELARAAVEGRPGVSILSDSDVATGFRLDSADQRVSVDGTLEGAMRRDRSRLSLIVAAALTRGGGRP